MRELRFLGSARWIGFAIFVVALSAVCIQLGIWQFHKLEDRQVRNELVREHLDTAPVPLEDVVPAGSAVEPDQEWTVVEVTGSYDVDHEVTVKFVNRDGRPGVDVLTPLLLEDGTAVLVDRGFTETLRTNARPETLPEPPDGEVQVTGWLRVDSSAGRQATQVFDGQVRAVSSRGMAEHVPYDLRSGYVDLQEQSPASSGLEPEPRPDLGQGPHFFYGLQWWFFAALAIVGYGWFARAERQERRTAAARAARTSPTTDEAGREVTPAR
ncbi:MAG: SURF1 family protein [Aeromicrobium sp.]|uniref:SURF1 family cytochrome oxidase biogenesis protein n=1 Tax=Aeromicrobium sp. TaxID=1871063 RepID=UPI002635CF14|nr:SURF1 family protein [Aeromicrobium sp.]MDF1705173.1 SURF1 family protein [Aeromicrobium sp.]